MDRIRHVVMPLGDGEFAACGLAFDVYSSGDHDTDDEFVDARPGLRVTCPDCCEAVRLWRAAAKGLRLCAKRGS